MANSKEAREGIKLINEYISTKKKADAIGKKSSASDKDKLEWQRHHDNLVRLAGKIQSLPEDVKQEIKKRRKNGPFFF